MTASTTTPVEAVPTTASSNGRETTAPGEGEAVPAGPPGGEPEPLGDQEDGSGQRGDNEQRDGVDNLELAQHKPAHPVADDSSGDRPSSAVTTKPAARLTRAQPSHRLPLTDLLLLATFTATTMTPGAE
jgi:hypothetical protein